MPRLCEPLLCNGCSACAAACPKGCISMVADGEGFVRPLVDAEACVDCGLCEKVCPVLSAPRMPAGEPTLWAAINENESDRAKASSGGVFVLLARWVLDRDGVVFGAAFQPDFSVAHGYAETEREAMRFCGSKYVQSRIGNAYQEAKTFLDRGRYVLFSGTPCQIMGLKSFLRKDYEKLIALDIICHGVPSPKVWQRYVSQRRELDHAGSLKRIEFRAKVDSWSRFSMRFTYDGGVYCESLHEDTYMRGFLRNLYLRPSCHRCIAKGVRRVSDVTLADFWGINNVCPEMNDDKGTSLVLLHSRKAREIWRDMGEELRTVSVGQEALQYNSAGLRSVDVHPNRKAFFQNLDGGSDLSALILELTPDPVVKPPSLYRRVRSRLGRMLHRWRAR